MGVIVTKVNPEDVDKLAYLDGPWRNDACTGYLIAAMKRLGYDRAEIADVIVAQRMCFDETPVKEAAKYWYDF